MLYNCYALFIEKSFIFLNQVENPTDSPSKLCSYILPFCLTLVDDNHIFWNFWEI